MICTFPSLPVTILFFALAAWILFLIIYIIIKYANKISECENYTKDPKGYMISVITELPVIKEFLENKNSKTMLFPYGSGIFQPQRKNTRNKTQKGVCLVYGLGKDANGKLTVLSLPFGAVPPDGFNLETKDGTPIDRYEHGFIEDLTDFIIDIYKIHY